MASACDDRYRDSAELGCAQRWLSLALAVLVFAGLFSLVVVMGRMPPFDRLVTDPLFFKRALVVHVNLALVAWFYSFVAALLFLLPGRGRPGWLARHSAHVAGTGVLLMLLAAATPGARPILSNYIPMIDHWLFTAGQLVFAGGVLASFAGRRRLRRAEGKRGFFEIPDAAEPGLRATAAALLLAALCFAIAWLNLPRGVVAPEVHYELVIWGGGHVLQLASTLAMLAVWLILLGSALGRAPLSRRGSGILFAALLLPWLVAPFLTVEGTWTSSYRTGFTHLMQWGIFPLVSIFLILCSASLYRARRDGRLDSAFLADPRISAFLVSGTLTLLGFALGASIRGSNTMVPAHYHASIGAVTVSFMAVTYLLMGAFGFSIATPRLRRAAAWQPLIYGIGQMVFAAGFGLAGAYGMARKASGAEQAARSAGETAGLVVMGVGGLIAVAGGLLFIGVVIAIWRRGNATYPEVQVKEGAWRYQWAREIRTASIRSRG